MDRIVGTEGVAIIDSGQWLSPVHVVLDALVDRVRDRIAGLVRLRLFSGAYSIVGRSTPVFMPARMPAIIPVANA
jgi:argininosuccinate synthase